MWCRKCVETGILRREVCKKLVKKVEMQNAKDDSEIYIRQRLNPVPDSQKGMWNRRAGLRSALRQRLEEQIRAIESGERTKPHTSEYERFHFHAKADARHLEAANKASLPRRPMYVLYII